MHFSLDLKSNKLVNNWEFPVENQCEEGEKKSFIENE
jgi:hypothetical protein